MFSKDDDNLYDNISKVIKVMYVTVVIIIGDVLYSTIKDCYRLFTSPFQWSIIYKLVSDLAFLAFTYFLVFKLVPLMRKKIAALSPHEEYENSFYKYLSKMPVCVSVFVALKKLVQAHRFYKAKDLLIPFESFLEKIQLFERYECIPHVKRVINILIKGKVPAGVCEYIIVSKPSNYNLKMGRTYVVVDRIRDYHK